MLAQRVTSVLSGVAARSSRQAASVGRTATAVTTRGVVIEARLKEMGIELPEPTTPVANYVSVARSGNLLFTAGHLPIGIRGRLGQDVTAEEGQAVAKIVAINIVSSLKAELGDLDRVAKIVKLTGFVNCVDGFSGQPVVVNGASDFIVELFGDKGIHSRSAVGVNGLPLNAPVEIEAIVEVTD